MQTRFSLQTQGRGLYEITDNVARWLDDVGGPEGLLTLFVRHTSCSLLIQETRTRMCRSTSRPILTG